MAKASRDKVAPRSKPPAPAIEKHTAVRASISFPPDVYRTLETIAKQKKVSLAWVVRDAAEQYIGARWPLFADESSQP